MTKKRILQLIPTILIVIPFLLLSFFDNWRLRMMLGLILLNAFPIVPLYFALNPKIRLTKFDPKEIPKERYILRNLGVFVRVAMVAFAILSAIHLTYPYLKGVAGLASKERDLDVVKGVIKSSIGVFPGSIGKRDFRVEGHSNDIMLLFPIGKKPRVGEEHEFFLLPDSDFAVDVRKIKDTTN